MNTAVKVNWRKQELIFLSIIAVMVAWNYIWTAISISDQELQNDFVQVSAMNQYTFKYGVNVLLPQQLLLLLVFGSYLLLNTFIARIFKQQKVPVKPVLTLAGLFLLVNVALSFGVATATDLARPWIFNYGHFHLLSLFGYRPNLFAAFSHAFLITGFFVLYALVREIIIFYVERSGQKNSYRILVANQVTSLIFAYFLAFLVIHFYGLFNRPDYRTYFAIVTPFLLVYLTNMYWLFPRHESDSTWQNWRFILSLTTTTFIFSLPFLMYQSARGGANLFFLYWAVQLVIVTPLSRYLYEQKRAQIISLRDMEKALSRSKADIRLLRSQINPHFLFNTLNTLYGTALQEGGQRTAEGIQRLGDMMRFMLHENESEKISLQKEIEYLENYIALQQLRVQSSANLQIESHIDSSQCHHSIAPMILIPLVENAFKHGISLVEPSWIHIQLACDSSSIRFEVRNSIHPKKQEDTTWESPGIGIANVTERLKLIYPGKHQVFFTNDGKEYGVQLTIRF